MKPAFLRELATPEYQRRLKLGVTSGYAVTAILILFGVIFHRLDLLPPMAGALIWLAPIKIFTNTLMWLALERKIAPVFFASINQVTDVVLLTTVIYFTGGPASPLTTLYFVVLAIVAMLANIGATIATAGAMIAAYGVMLGLMSAHVLDVHQPFMQTVYQSGSGVTWELVVVDLFKLGALVAIMLVAISSVLELLKQREAELEEANEQLREANRLKSEFVANVTHELRTPIHGVMGLTEMLTDGIYGDVTDRQIEALSNIDRSAQNLLEMVDDLLRLERVEAGSVSLKIEMVDPAALAKESLDVANWMRGKRQLKLAYEGPDDLPRFACDRGMLLHLLTNLLSNAVKFTPEDGTVTLRAKVEPQKTEDDEEHMVFEVEDTGIGIDEEHLDVIFEAFRQVDGSSQRRFGGAGLGLSVVTHLARMLDAEVSVESTLGQGTTFRVAVPIRLKFGQSAGS